MKTKHLQPTAKVSSLGDRDAKAKARSHATVPPLLSLQRAIGNRAVNALIDATWSASHSKDVCEHEADGMAAKVFARAHLTDTLTRSGMANNVGLDEQEAVPRRLHPASQMQTGPSVAPTIQKAIGTQLGRGCPLAGDERTIMENSFGVDFGDVRIHDNALSDSLSNALNVAAFAVGSNVFFKQNGYRWNDPVRLAVLAHELTHVVQQRATGAEGRGRQVSTHDLPAVQPARRQAPIIQCLSVFDFLNYVYQTAVAAQRWSDDFREALDFIATAKDEQPLNLDLKDWKVRLTGQEIEHGGKYKKALHTIQYCLGERKTSVGLSSIKDLHIEASGVVGRPGFPIVTQKFLTTAPGQHRRHIAAWHTMRAFVSQAYGDLGDVLIGKLAELLDKVAPHQIAKEGLDLLAKAPPALFGDVPKDKGRVLLTALYVMNGNPNNLWVGLGTENSTINTASTTIKEALLKCQSLEELAGLAEKWDVNPGPEGIVADAKSLTAEVIFAELRAIQGLQETRDNPKGALAYIHQKIEAWVNATLEIDVIAGNKDITKEIHGPRQEYVQAAVKMFSYTEGHNTLTDYTENELNALLTTMLRYPDDFYKVP